MLIHLIEKTAQALDNHFIPYMIIGGQAVLYYGEPRMTRDIDITLGVGPERLPAVLEMIREAGIESLVDDPETFVAQTMVLPCRDSTSHVTIDFIFSLSSYEKEAISRAVTVTIGGTSVAFASVEDLIIHKLIAGRPRDIEDVRGIVRKGATIDEHYIRTRLEAFEAALDRSFITTLNDILCPER